MNKICYQCHELLSELHFQKNASTWDGLSIRCKTCLKLKRIECRPKKQDSLYWKIYRQENKDKIKAYYQKTKERRKLVYLDRREEFLAKSKQWRNKNKEKVRLQAKADKKANPLKYTIRKRIYRQKRYKQDIVYRIKMNLKSRVQTELQGLSKYAGAATLLGCSCSQLKLHLETQFIEGMNWTNYGQYGWHVDHIKPIVAFDLNNIEDQKKCFHYTNLQPLWAKDNLLKGNNFYE